MAYTVPGVYVEEIPSLPPSVAAVGTAIPAFFGHTSRHIGLGGSNFDAGATIPAAPTIIIRKINSFLDYQSTFGGPATNDVTVSNTAPYATLGTVTYRMYYSLQLYFMNGGGPCYVVSVGDYNSPAIDGLSAGLDMLDAMDEPTIYVVPDRLDDAAYKGIVELAVSKCAALGDRMFLADVERDPASLRSAGLGAGASYCAAYAPHLETTIVPVADLSSVNPNALHLVKAAVANLRVTLPASPAVAAAYVVNDASRGVAHAPANMPLSGVSRPTFAYNETQLGEMNVDPTAGKSVNVIRQFTGKGTLIWGARTMDGNSNEWRYVPVRRFFNMVEESVKKATMAYVFEPNNATTWQSVKTMVANFLNLQWRDGALQGAKPNEAYFVKVGLGETMTPLDVQEGRLIVQIGMAVNRPAEFIILQFSHFVAQNA